METLKKYFVIDPINRPEYADRLDSEIKLLNELNLIWFIERVKQIFNLNIKSNLYLLRGSAGSSLLLYYLGINEIDPVLHSIPLSRFINKLRISPPDIDIDVPLNSRDIIMNKIVESNVDTIRMSSNHENENNKFFESLVSEDPLTSHIHNSGIIIFPKNKKQIIEDNKITPTQIKLTKHNIYEYDLKKVDLLSNTALEQLSIIQKQLEIQNILKCNYTDDNVYNFMVSDDGTGVTYAETPIIQYVIKLLKPKSIEQLSICLGIVRPFACYNIRKNISFDDLQNSIIFDDDFINFLVNKLNYLEDEADQIRRIFKKGEDMEFQQEFIRKVELSNLTELEKKILLKSLSRLSKYSFCRAHSLSYARMIYCLYFYKYHQSKIFWSSTIKTIKGYYNDWVYIRKGLSHGLKFKGYKKYDSFHHFVYTGYWLNKQFMTKCYLKLLDNLNASTSCNFEKESIIELEQPTDEQTADEQTADEQTEQIDYNEHDDAYYNLNSYDLDNYGLGRDSLKNPKPEEPIKTSQLCEFRGIIAGVSHSFTRYKKNQTVITIGYDNDKFIDLYLNRNRNFKRFKQVVGKGFYVDESNLPHIIITQMNLF